MINLLLPAIVSSFIVTTMGLPVVETHSNSNGVKTSPIDLNLDPVNEVDSTPERARQGVRKWTRVKERLKGDNSQRLNFRITNLKTNKEETFDPSVHLFHPTLHHPERAKTAIKDLTNKAVANPDMSRADFMKEENNLKVVMRGAQHINKGGVVADHSGGRLYWHDGLDPREAIEKMEEGSARKIKTNTNGRLSILKPQNSRSTRRHDYERAQYYGLSGAEIRAQQLSLHRKKPS